MALKQEQSVESSSGGGIAGEGSAAGHGTTNPLAARFLNQGTFESYAAALEELRGWAARSGYPLSALAAWITVGSKVRVQLATRSYWKPLTPRGQAREALCPSEPAQDLLCLEFRRGHVQAHQFDELRRAQGNSSLSGAA